MQFTGHQVSYRIVALRRQYECMNGILYSHPSTLINTMSIMTLHTHTVCVESVFTCTGKCILIIISNAHTANDNDTSEYSVLRRAPIPGTKNLKYIE